MSYTCCIRHLETRVVEYQPACKCCVCKSLLVGSGGTSHMLKNWMTESFKQGTSRNHLNSIQNQNKKGAALNNLHPRHTAQKHISKNCEMVLQNMKLKLFCPSVRAFHRFCHLFSLTVSPKMVVVANPNVCPRPRTHKILVAVSGSMVSACFVKIFA